MTNSPGPLVSVIVPAFNVEAYIEEAIRSILNQTYTNLEVLVIDDHSSDGTVGKVRSLMESLQDPRLQLLQPDEKFRKPSKVRNYGLRRATGDYLTFFDSDDVYYLNAIALLVAELEAHSQLIAVHGFADYMDVHGNPLPLVAQTYGLNVGEIGEKRLPSNYPLSWEAILAGHFQCFLPCLMIRRSTLETIGYINEELHSYEDTDYYARLFLHDRDNVKIIPEYLMSYRQRPDSLTKATDNDMLLLESALKGKAAILAMPNLPPVGYDPAYRSFVMMDSYRYLARERLHYGQPWRVYKLILMALGNRDIYFKDWLDYGFPLLLRALIPTRLDAWLARNKPWKKLRRG